MISRTCFIITEVIQQNYWMGANDFKEGDWRWVNDLSKLHFTSWQSSQPDNAGGKEDCGHFWQGQNYQWNDAPCNLTVAFICESPLVSIIYQVAFCFFIYSLLSFTL